MCSAAAFLRACNVRQHHFPRHIADRIHALHAGLQLVVNLYVFAAGIHFQAQSLQPVQVRASSNAYQHMACHYGLFFVPRYADLVLTAFFGNLGDPAAGKDVDSVRRQAACERTGNVRSIIDNIGSIR